MYIRSMPSTEIEHTCDLQYLEPLAFTALNTLTLLDPSANIVSAHRWDICLLVPFVIGLLEIMLLSPMCRSSAKGSPVIPKAQVCFHETLGRRSFLSSQEHLRRMFSEVLMGLV